MNNLRGTGLFIILFLLFFLLMSCASMKDMKREEEYYLERGKNFIRKKQPAKAIDDFKYILSAYSGSSIVAEAQYYLGEAHLAAEEWIQAAFEYENVYENYSSSRFAGDARYKKAYCYMMQSLPSNRDQEYSLKAIAEFNRFLEEYPDNKYVEQANDSINELKEKLAKKRYLNGCFYLKSKKYKSAIMYFESFLVEYPGSKWTCEVLYQLGIAHLRLNEFEEARNKFEMILTSQCDLRIMERSQEKIDRIPKLKREAEKEKKKSRENI